MARKPYGNNEIESDSGDIFTDKALNVVLPSDPNKYITLIWTSGDTFSKTAWLAYGTINFAWLVSASNGFKQQEDFTFGQKLKLLKPEFLREIKYG